MNVIGKVPEILAVKTQLEELKAKGLIKEWEVPYEDILTRLTAAIFYVTPAEEAATAQIWQALGSNPRLAYRLNEEKELSELMWRVEFNNGFEL
jgi:hypothetical protein